MNNVVTFYSKKPRPITVNGEPISEDDIEATLAQFAETPDPREAAARSLAIRALLRQQAIAQRIEAEDEETAIEKLLAQAVPPAQVSDEEVRRYYEGNRQKFTNGDLFEAHHILFDTRNGDKELVRKADAVLLQIKNDPESFESVAREQSSCTSASLGGSLGQLSPGSVVPEFWSALVAFGKTGLLPHLVETRFGHHIVRIDHCVRGKELPLEMVEARIREFLCSRLEQLAHQAYVAGLIEKATLSGVDFGDQKPLPPGPGLPRE